MSKSWQELEQAQDVIDAHRKQLTDEKRDRDARAKAARKIGEQRFGELRSAVRKVVDNTPDRAKQRFKVKFVSDQRTKTAFGIEVGNASVRVALKTPHGTEFDVSTKPLGDSKTITPLPDDEAVSIDGVSTTAAGVAELLMTIARNLHLDCERSGR